MKRGTPRRHPLADDGRPHVPEAMGRWETSREQSRSPLDRQLHLGLVVDVLLDLYVGGKYRDFILPMTVWCQLDAVFEDSNS